MAKGDSRSLVLVSESGGNPGPKIGIPFVCGAHHHQGGAATNNNGVAAAFTHCQILCTAGTLFSGWLNFHRNKLLANLSGRF